MKKLLSIVAIGLLWCNVGFADQILRLRCNPEDTDQGVFNFLFNLTQSKVVERNEYKINFPIKSTAPTIAFVESSLPQNEKTPLFRVKIDRYSGRMNLIYYQLNNSETKRFKKIIKKQYSKSGDKVQSYIVALNEFKEIGEFYYNCK